MNSCVFGTGLVAVITLSVLRLVPPEPAVEIPVVLGAAAIAFLLGYLTPHPAPPPAVAESDTTVRLAVPPTQEFTR